MFSEVVTAPSVADFVLTGTDGAASITSVTGSGTTYAVTVNTGSGAQNGQTLGLDFVGASVKDQDGTADSYAGGTSHGPTVTVDTVTPSILSVVASGSGITAGSGSLNAGKAVTLTVNFSETVLVTTAGGTPRLLLDDGGVATYTGGSGTSALTFAYTVAAGQNTGDLSVTSLSLNGGTIKDAAGHAADLAGAGQNPAGTLVVDTAAPSLASFTPDSAVTSASSVTYTALFSESVTGITAAAFSLDAAATDRAASITSVTGSGTTYTVTVATGGPGHSGTIQLDFGGTVTDLAGNVSKFGGFQTRSTYAAGAYPAYLAFGDVNEDGKPDLVTTNEGTDTLSVLLGNGNGTFQPATSVVTGSTPGGLAVADLNGDGHLDLVAAPYSDNTVQVFLGNGNGTFQNASTRTYAVASGPTSILAVDVDKNGTLDLVVTSNLGGATSVLLGNGDGSFQSALSAPANTFTSRAAVVDVNQDGKLDLVTGYSAGVQVALGNGDGTFQGAADIWAAQVTGIVAADLNADGKADLVFTDKQTNKVFVMLGNGDGSFRSPTSYVTGTDPEGVAAGDVNGDGKLDLVVVNQGSSNLSVLLGNGNGTFQAATSMAAGSTPYGLALGDLNGDGKADIASGNNSGATSVSVFLTVPSARSGTATFEAPFVNTAPSGADNTVTVTEDTPYSFTAADFGFSDVDGNPLASVVISTLPAAGLLVLSGGAVRAGQEIAVASIPSLQFIPALDTNGVAAAAFTFQVRDSGGVAYGGQDLDPTPNRITFDVTAVDDAPSFASGTGKVITTVGTDNDQARSVQVQPDGKIVVVGASYTGSGNGVSVVRYNADGSLDSTFGSGGKVITSVGSYGVGYGVQLQPDGKIVVAGVSSSDFVVLRYNADGTPDTTFGANHDGISSLGASGVGHSVQLQSDGKIVVAGYNSGTADFALARYNADGTLDTTFGANHDGTVSTPVLASYDVGQSVQLQPDGKIVVAGYSTYNDDSSSQFAVVRYAADGTLDTTFGANRDGKVVTALTSYDTGYSVLVQSDGKIVVAGTSSNGSNNDYSVVRYNTDGTLDITFGANHDGKVITPVGPANDAGFSAQLQPDGKIVVAGYASDGNRYDFSVVRYNTDGTLDSTFGTGGKVVTGVGSNDYGQSVQLQPDGKIVVAGYSLSGPYYHFSVVRYNADGTLDTRFDLANTLDGAPTFIDGGSPVVLDGNVQVYDAELHAAGNYGGASLTLARHGGANVEDTFSAKSGGNLSPLTEGGALTLSGVIIGTVTQNSVGQLVLTFDASATEARVNEAMQDIAYADASHDPPGSVQLDWSFSDGNTGAQGTGGAQAVTGSTTVSIVAINDPPTLSATGATTTYTENTTGVDLFSGVSVSAVEAADTIKTLTLTVSGVVDGTNEVLRIDGSDLALTDGSVVTTATNGLTASVAVVSGTATVTLSKAAGVAASIVASIVDGLTYRDVGDDPTSGARTITLTSIQDTGGTADSGQDTTSLNVQATIGVVAVNDAPTLTTTALGPNFTEAAGLGTQAAPVGVFSNTAASAVEAGQTILGLTFKASGLIDGANEKVGIDGSSIALTDGARGTTANVGFAYSVAVASGTATVTLTKVAGVSAAAINTLVDGITYQDVNADNPTGGDRIFTLTQIKDSGGVANGGVDTATLSIASTVHVVPVDDAPSFGATLDGAPSFTEGGSPVVLDANVQVYDAELHAAGNYGGASLTLARHGGTNAEDAFSAKSGGNLAALTETGALTLSGVAIGTVTQNSAGQLVLTFNADATEARVNEAMQDIAYADTSHNPPPSAQIDWLFSDGNTGTQGTGGAQAVTGSTTVSITAINDVPVATASGGAAAVSEQVRTIVDPAVTLSDVDNTTLASATVSITGGYQSGEDVLAFVNVGTATYGNIAASFNALTGVLTLSSAGSTATVSQFEAALRAVTYTDTSDAPSTADRTISFQANDGAASSAVVSKTITVAAVDDAPSFAAGTGTLITPVGTSDDRGYSVQVQPDGKIVVAGYSNNGTDNDFAIVRYTADGTLDTTLGAGTGKVITPVGSGDDYGQSVQVQPDGKIVVAGYSSNASYREHVAVVRYNADGTLDTTFGTGTGQVITTIGGILDQGYSVQLQPDGKIVVAGSARVNGEDNFAVVRYNADGSLDSSFGGGTGEATTYFGFYASVGFAARLQADGKIVVVGYDEGTTETFAVARFHADGTLDTTFGAGTGKVTTSVGGTADVATSVQVQPDGKIVVAGTGRYTTPDNLVENAFEVVRYNTDGSLDTSFNGTGKVITPVGSFNDVGESVLLQPDGKIVVAGSTGDPRFGGKFALVRYNGDGSLDTTFGPNHDGTLTMPVGAGAAGYSVTLQPDGKLVVAGHSTSSYNSDNDFTVLRFNADGSLDTRFNLTNTLDGAPSFTEGGAAVLLDGNVAVYDAELHAAGTYAGASLTLARHNGASADDHFGASGNLSALTESGALVLSGVTIGTVTQDSGGTLVLTFNGNATEARVDAALRSLTYSNGSDLPPASAQIDWTFSDGNTGGQGGGGAQSGLGSTTVSITAINDAPTVTTLPAYLVAPGVMLTVDGFTFADADAGGGVERVTFQVNRGALTATASSGITFTTSSTNTATLTAQGTLADLNSFISGDHLSFKGTQNATLSITLDDQGHTPGPSRQATALTAIVVDTAPTASAVAGSGSEDGGRIALTLGGSDPDAGDAVTNFHLASLPGHGQVFLAASGGSALSTTDAIAATSDGAGGYKATVYVQPTADYNGADSFTYTAFDGDLTSLPANAVITVGAVQDANADTLTSDANLAATVNVLTNDTFGAGAAISAVTQGTHGTVSFAADGHVTYNPAAGYSGSDAFTYTADTPGGTAETASVTVTVLPPPTLSVSDVTLAEGHAGTTAFTFTVSLSAASGLTATVAYSTADGTAHGGSDYAAASGTLTFAPGETSKQVTVLATGDTVFEGNETFALTLSAPTNATIGTGSGTGTIQNDDAAPTFAIGDVTVSEGAGTATFTVTKTGATELAATVDYATADGTAHAAVGAPGTPDYTATGGTLTFAAGETTKVVTVSLADDAVYEAAEQFAVTLTNPTGATIADGLGVGTITDDDAVPTLSIGDVTVSEADGAASFTVTLTGATALPIAVGYATADGTAHAAAGGPGTPDYAATSGTLTFSPSASGSQILTVTVPLTNDGTLETTESFAANLSGPTNGATISDGQGIATITDDDTVPSVSVDTVSHPEGNAGTAAYTFTVSLSAPSALTTTVDYATQHGTAHAGSDYASTSGTLTFAPGEASKTVSVLATGDTVFEGDETFALTLSAPTNATIGTGSGTGTIQNDDAAPTFAIGDVTVSEAAGTATFTVTKTGATELAATVAYATADGTAHATAGDPGNPDYGATSGTLTFGAGETTKVVTVTIGNDAVYEAAEQFAVNLSNATGATIADGQGVGTITDDDAAPTLSIGDVTVSEATGTATFTVTLTGATALPISVDYGTQDGTAHATAGGPGTPDYAATSGTLTFGPSASGTQMLTVTVPVTNDAVDETTEAFAINLSGATNGAAITDAQGIGTITNDDSGPTLSVSDVAVAEGQAGTTAFVFTVSLSGESAQIVTVGYATQDGTALAGSDYGAASGTLTFAPGETTKTVTVLASGDTVFEGDQTFFVNLSGPTHATIADGQAIGTIGNDDLAPTLSIGDAAVSEAAGTATFTITRTGATEVPISVAYGTADGTAHATAGGPGTPDYSAASGTLTFAPSLATDATQSVTVAIDDDSVYEATEHFAVNLTNAVGATIVDARGIGTILDDEPPNAPPVLTAGNMATYTENAAPVAVAPGATVVDPTSSSFDGGSLTVAFGAGGGAEDQLTILSEGTGAGQIGVSGAIVTFSGTPIGIASGGAGGTPLVVSFTGAAATPAAAQALLRAVAYSDSSDDPSEAPRTLTYSLDDGGGTAGGAAFVGTASSTLTVTPVNDAPVFGGDGTLAILQGGTTTITLADLSTTDAETASAQLSFTVTGTSHGSLLVDGNEAATFTQADLAAGRVAFQQDGSASDTAGFAVTVSDGIATAGPRTVSVAIDLAPVATGISYGANDGTLRAGETVLLSLAASEPVAVTGIPVLMLNDGGTAAYVSGSGTATLVFSHTVAPGQNAADLAVTGLATSGGAIQDGAGQALGALPAGGVDPAGVLLVDTVAPSTPSVSLVHDTGVSATDGITGDATLAVAKDADATLLYAADGGAFAPTPPVFIQDGPHTVLVRAVDGAGNATDSAPLAFTLDTNVDQGPVAALAVDGTANAIIDLYESHRVHVAVAGLDPDARAVATFTDGQHSLSASVAQDGAFAIDLSGFDGMVSSSLVITDLAGNAASRPGNAVLVDVDAFQSLFGTVVHDASSPAGQVFELYEGLLGRAPDPAGFEFQVDALAHGTSLAQVAAGFLNSPEFVAAHGSVSAETDAGFVSELYQVVLGRTGEPGGQAFWQGALARGVSRGEVAADFALSAEHLSQDQGHLSAGVFAPDPVASDVARLYYAVLDRAPDADGLPFWTEHVKAGLSELAVADAFLHSNEYAASFGASSDAAFVAQIYDGALGRDPDPSGLAFYETALASGQSRASVALAIADSSEANLHHLAEIEQGWHIP